MATITEPVLCEQNLQKSAPGGCALRGAKLALQPITDAVHVVHGSASCLGHVWSSRPTLSSHSLLHRYSVTTALREVDLVMGAGEPLQKLLDRVRAELNPAAIFVYQSCLTAMVGDDLRAECRRAALRLGIPVLAVEAPGLVGGKQVGHQLAVRLLCDQVIGTQEPDVCGEAEINLIGEFNVRGEVEELRKVLGNLGIHMLASIPGDAGFRDIAQAHRAKVSLDLCSQAMPQLAERLREQYGIPFVRGSIYGSRAFAETLRKLVHLLVANGADKEIERRTCIWLEEEQNKFNRRLAAFKSRLDGKRIMIYAGGVKTWTLPEDLQAAGLIVRGVSLHKCSGQDKDLHAVIRKKCSGNGFREWSEDELDGLLKSGGVDLILSGGGMKYLAHKYGIPCVEVSHERRFSLFGFEGMLNLLEEIDLLINSPVLQLAQNQTLSERRREVSQKATIIAPPPGSMNPFALTQPMGAALAMQGVRRCAPLLFGAQGCAASGLIFLSRAFGEQIQLSTVNMNESDTIYGGQSALREACAELEMGSPDMIAVISTGAMDLQGASDICLPGYTRAESIFISTPDYEGTLQDGWGKAVHALVRYALQKRAYQRAEKSRKILILPGVHLSISDLEWIKETAAAFELTPLMVPDISTALDGHAGEDAVMEGGVALSQIEQIADCACWLAVGEQMQPAAEELSRAGVPGVTLSGWMGAGKTDALLDYLAEVSGLAVPKKYVVQRMQLVDAMMDYLRPLSRIHAAVAAEPDLLMNLCGWLRELGAKNIIGVSPVTAQSLHHLPLNEVYVGDYLVLAAQMQGCNILLAPDSAQAVAHTAGVAHYGIGIHEPRQAGAQFRSFMGYHGAREQLFSLINRMQ